MVVENENQSDGHIEANQDDLDPAFKETLLMLSLSDWPVLLILRCLVTVGLCHCVQGVNMLELGDLDKVFEFEELLHTCKLNPSVLLSVLSSVLRVEYVQNLFRHFPVSFIMIVIVEDIG